MLKKKFWRSIKALYVILAVGVVLGAFLYKYELNSRANIYFKQSEINKKTVQAINKAALTKNATSSAKLASIKSSTQSAQITVPKNYGRQVNVPILTYHYIGNNPNPADKARDALEVTPDKFEEQMAYLSKNGYSPVSLDTLYAALKGGLLPSKPIVLTFDDGYVDFYLNAFPILRRYNLHATSFIPTGLMNQGYYMSWAQIKEIDSTGLVSFQAHSVNHPNLTSLNTDQLKYQLFQSKKVLEQELGKPVNFMAYPYGASNENVWNEAKNAGYFGSVGTYYGTIESEGNIYNMPRIKISGAWSIEEFSKRI